MSVYQQLCQRYQQQRLAHALIVSDTQTALDFAKFLFCRDQKLNFQACEQCADCQLFKSGNHPDFYLINADNEHAQIKIEKIRDLLQALTQTALRHGYRIAIVEHAHNLNISAANALLKTLEEPGEQTLMMLVTTRPGLLPSTIRSRAQLAVAAEAEAARTSLGAEFWAQFKKCLLGQIDPVALASVLAKQDLAYVVDGLQSGVEDLVRIKTNFPLHSATNQSCFDLFRELAPKFTFKKLFNFLDHLTEIRRGLVHHLNPNMQLLLEEIFCQYAS